MTDYAQVSPLSIRRCLNADEYDRLVRGLAATFYQQSPAGDWETRTPLRVGDVIRVSREQEKTFMVVRIIEKDRIQRGVGTRRPQWTYYYSVAPLAENRPVRPWGVA